MAHNWCDRRKFDTKTLDQDQAMERRLATWTYCSAVVGGCATETLS